jgi:hypothetical protein
LENTKEMLDYAYKNQNIEKLLCLLENWIGIKKKCLLDLCLINLKEMGCKDAAEFY